MLTWNDLLVEILSMPPEKRKEKVCTGPYSSFGICDYESGYTELKDSYGDYCLIRE